MQTYYARIKATLVLVSLLAGSLLIGCSTRQGPNDYKLEGTFIEGSNCSNQSKQVVGALQNGCQGVGVISLTGGRFMNVDLKGAKIAYGVDAGNWVSVFVDAANPVQREAVKLFAKQYLNQYGAIDTVKEASIQFSGEKGNYTAEVNNGTILQMTTQPVVGGDNENPISYGNTRNKLSPTLLEARAVSANFNDGNRRIELRDADAFFNNQLSSSGSL